MSEADIRILEQTIKLNGKRIQPEIINAMENLISKAKELQADLFASNSIINEYTESHKEQEKMIELMAEYIKEADFITESYCYRREDCENVGGNRMCKECILDYFRKKARGDKQC